MVTYAQRVAQMLVPEDVDKQLLKAKKYAMNLHNEAKNPSLLLGEKLAIHENAKKADRVLRKLRHNSFDLDDMLAARQTA